MMKNDFKHNRRKNFLVSILIMAATVCIYIFNASLASESDNVGMLIVPPLILFFYGPFVSFILALIQAYRQATYENDFSGFSDKIFQNMSRVLWVFGLFGLALITILFGTSLLGILLLPFWSLNFLL